MNKVHFFFNGTLFYLTSVVSLLSTRLHNRKRFKTAKRMNETMGRSQVTGAEKTSTSFSLEQCSPTFQWPHTHPF